MKSKRISVFIRILRMLKYRTKPTSFNSGQRLLKINSTRNFKLVIYDLLSIRFFRLYHMVDLFSLTLVSSLQNGFFENSVPNKRGA